MQPRRTFLQACLAAPAALFVPLADHQAVAASDSPALPPIRPANKLPTPWTTEQLERLYATIRADKWRPAGWSFTGYREPAKFWESMCRVKWDTDLGAHVLFQLLARDVDPSRDLLVLPAAITESGRQEVLYLHPTTIASFGDVLAQGDLAPLFPWTGHRGTFFKHFRRLLKAAGLSAGRKATATALDHVSPDLMAKAYLAFLPALQDGQQT
jgi:hypothetical protein